MHPWPVSTEAPMTLITKQGTQNKITAVTTRQRKRDKSGLEAWPESTEGLQSNQKSQTNMCAYVKLRKIYMHVPDVFCHQDGKKL